MRVFILIFMTALIGLSGCSKNPLGSSSKASDSFHPGYVPGPNPETPTITSISPNTGPIMGGTTITITGTGFESGATVFIGGSLCQNLVFASTTQLTCVTPGHVAGQVGLVVTNPSHELASLTPGFTYVGVANPKTGFAATSGGGISKSGSFRLHGTAGVVGNPIVVPGTTMSVKSGLQGAITTQGQ